MPITLPQLLIAITILIGVPTMTVVLNRRRRGWGWAFLAGVIAIFVIGNLIECLTT